MKPWIGVDLDGTLAEWYGWVSNTHIGNPIWPMVEKVREWLKGDMEVKIFTARADEGEEAIKAIKDWCQALFGRELEITNKKDYGMVELWDDRCMQVFPNTGISVYETYYKTIGGGSHGGD